MKPAAFTNDPDKWDSCTLLTANSVLKASYTPFTLELKLSSNHLKDGFIAMDIKDIRVMRQLLDHIETMNRTARYSS
jgi:hypothetical protein